MTDSWVLIMLFSDSSASIGYVESIFSLDLCSCIIKPIMLGHITYSLYFYWFDESIYQLRYFGASRDSLYCVVIIWRDFLLNILAWTCVAHTMVYLRTSLYRSLGTQFKGKKNSGVLDYWIIMGIVFYDDFGICNYLESRDSKESSTVSLSIRVRYL